jgi:hypothetical protein
MMVMMMIIIIIIIKKNQLWFHNPTGRGDKEPAQLFVEEE